MPIIASVYLMALGIDIYAEKTIPPTKVPMPSVSFGWPPRYVRKVGLAVFLSAFMVVLVESFLFYRAIRLYLTLR